MQYDNTENTCDCASNKYSLYPRLPVSSYTAEHKSVGTMDRKDSTVACKCSRSSVFIWLLEGTPSVLLTVSRCDRDVGRDNITSKRCNVANEIYGRANNAG